MTKNLLEERGLVDRVARIIAKRQGYEWVEEYNLCDLTDNPRAVMFVSVAIEVIEAVRNAK